MSDDPHGSFFKGLVWAILIVAFIVLAVISVVAYI